MAIKRMPSTILSAALASSIALSCASLPPKKPITFALAETVRLGLKAEEVAKILGKPDRIPTDLNTKSEVWIYDSAETHLARLALLFDPESKILISSTFEVNDGEPEASLSYLSKHYPGSRFEKLPPVLIHGSDTGESRYVDHRTGISLRLNDHDQTVGSISWREPENRTMAGEKKGNAGSKPHP